ncbi:MAG: hypothetical protein JO212_19860 [Acetobacteraceae bacterium]|nr:hypothetical protein [Acetobacteraceae bacterium]MBV8592279.1 hypothetical protein [Acetobacteraceae bacterium]
MFRVSYTTIAAASAAVLFGGAVAADPLPTFNVDRSQTSVSGLSSGAFMAVQFHTAYSADIMGAGVVAGGPYNCAYVNLGGIETCTRGLPRPIGSASAASAKEFAARKDIDSTKDLRRSRVYIFSGTKDTVIAPAVVEETYNYYKAVGVPDSNIQYVHNVPAGHAFIAPSWGNDCGVNASPYINHCTVDGAPYDQAGAILTQIYGPLNAPAGAPAGRLVSFEQKPFGDSGMGDNGFLYVPPSCDHGETCRIHVAFHGCKQTFQDIRDQYYTDTGYNRWADTNHILVLYPQAATDLLGNPEHCWDWWGYTGLRFNVKVAPQMSAVEKMIDHLARGL